MEDAIEEECSSCCGTGHLLDYDDYDFEEASTDHVPCHGCKGCGSVPTALGWKIIHMVERNMVIKPILERHAASTH